MIANAYDEPLTERHIEAHRRRQTEEDGAPPLWQRRVRPFAGVQQLFVEVSKLCTTFMTSHVNFFYNKIQYIDDHDAAAEIAEENQSEEPQQKQESGTDTTVDSEPQKICHRFAQTGQCVFGEQCKFAHVLPNFMVRIKVHG